MTTIPRGVWILGLVSLCMDLSSEMIHSLLPVFLTTVLGVGALAVGIIEGIAEATASLAKVVSGVYSDRMGKRKPLILAGYGLAAVTKPVFALAPTVGWVVAARFIDRVGKGLRGAPRDALMADITPPEMLGASFGLRQSLDTVGAFAGPLVAIGLMVLTQDDIRQVFWWAALPALAAVLLILLGVREPESHHPVNKKVSLSRAELSRLPRAFWGVVGVTALMTLARFSEAFLILRAQSVGLSLAWTPLVLVVMNVIYAASSYPVGKLSDTMGRRGLLMAGFVLLVVADGVLAWWESLTGVMVGVALWGLHMGMTQGLLAALVAEAAPRELRGTAFGLFHLVSGVALLLASVTAGGLWSLLGPGATFLGGAAWAVLSLVLLMIFGRARPAGQES